MGDSIATDESSLGPLDNFDHLNIDSEWESKRYKHVILLLLKDHNFPKNFNVEILNEEVEDEKHLIEFTQERNFLHKWVEENEYEKVKEFTSKRKSKLYLNSRNESATYTALINRRFKILAYLESVDVNLKSHEKDSFNYLSDKEKHELREAMLPYFEPSEKSHIYYLKSKIKIKSKNPFEEHKNDLFNHLKELDKVKEISILLKVIQYVDNLELVLDLDNESVAEICPSASNSERGITYPFQKVVYVAAGGKRLKKEVLGTLGHELSHLAMYTTFDNNSKPYFKTDEEICKAFGELTKNQKEAVRNLSSCTALKILAGAFNEYYEKGGQEESELIARVPHILAQCADGKKWLAKNTSELFKFFSEQVIPECEKFVEQSFLLKPKNFNRSMNETEGEIINIKKCCLFFKNIDDLKKFFNTKNMKVFALITEYTGLGLLRALQGIYGKNYLDYYYRFLVFKLENFAKNCEEVSYLFRSEATEAIFIECPDIMRDFVAIEKIMESVVEKEEKRIIFVTKKEANEEFMDTLDGYDLRDFFVEETDENYSLCDLIDDSRKEILKNVVTFQGKKLSLGDLIGCNEDLYEYIDARMMEDMMNKKRIELGSKPFGTSNLEGAYADVIQEINLPALIYEINCNQSVFVINGKKTLNWKSELHECLNQEVDKSIMVELRNFQHEVLDSERIFFAEGRVTDDDFKEFCYFNSKKKIYHLQKSNTMFNFLKFYNPDFYFKRQFKRYDKIIIKRELLYEENISDMFIICEDSDNKLAINFRSPNFILSNLENAEDEFKKLSQSGKTVHVLKYENSQLVLIKTAKKLKNLCNWIDEEEGEEIVKDEMELVSKIINEKVVILADDPGMGKSTSITKLYETDEIVKSHWVIRTNLKDQLNAIRELKEPINTEEIIIFLTKIDNKLKNDVTKNFLKAAIDLGKQFSKCLLLCFDGFDELVDFNDRRKILSLFQYLHEKTKCKIWITTRVHHKKDLEDEFSVLSIKFNPIDDSSKMDFIKNYLKNRLKLTLAKETYDEIFETSGKINENSKLSIYLKLFLKKAKEIFKGEYERFIGTPLQLYLLLEGSAIPFRNWIENSEELNFSYLGNNLVEVYENFFNRKYEIYFKKTKVPEEGTQYIMKVPLEKCHEELAYSLANNEELEGEINEMKSSVLLLGITKTENGKIQFVHFTFQEFFVAQYLIENFRNSKDKELLQKLHQDFIGLVLIHDEYEFVRRFINLHLENEGKRACLKKYETNFKEIILSSENNPAYHIAIQEHNNNIFDFFLQFLSDEEYFAIVNRGWTYIKWFKGGRYYGEGGHLPVLHFAIKRKNHSALNLIIEIASKYGLEEKLLSVVDGDGNPPLHLAVMFQNDDAFDKILDLASHYKLDRQQLEVVSKRGMTLFYIAIWKKNDHAFDRILDLASKLDLMKKLLTAALNRSGETPFDVAAEFKNDYALKKILKLASESNCNFERDLLNATEKYKHKAFSSAIANKNDLAVEKILELASKFNFERDLLTATDKYKHTAFSFAIAKKNDLAVEKILELALKYNLEQELITAVDGDRDKAIHLAVLYKNDFALNKILELASKYDMIEPLLTAINKHQNTAFHLAVKKSNDFAFDRIMELAFTDIKRQLLTAANSSKSRVLHLAVSSGYDNGLSKILESASKLDLCKKLLTEVDSEKNTPIHLAINNWNGFAFDRILELSAHYDLNQLFLNAFNSNGNTILHLAVEKRYDFAFSRILELASTYNQEMNLLTVVNKDENTLFHLAIIHDYGSALERIFELALKHNYMKELLTATNANKYTGIYLAMFHNNKAVIRIIIVASEHNLLQEILVAPDNNKGSLFHFAIMNRCFEVENAVGLIINRAPIYNYVQLIFTALDNNKCPVFHLAIRHDSSIIFGWLVSLASKNNLLQAVLASVDNEKRTPFHVAVEIKNNNALSKIIELASKYDLCEQLLFSVDNNNDTAFNIAVKSKYNLAIDRILEVAKKFNLEKKLLTTASEWGDTALHLAIALKHYSVIEKIIKFAEDSNLGGHVLTIANKCGLTALQFAVWVENDFALNLILPLIAKNKSNEQLLTCSVNPAFHLAIEIKNNFAFSEILEFSKNNNLDKQLITALNIWENTTFHVAVLAKNDFALNCIIKLASAHDLEKQLLTAIDYLENTACHLAIKSKNNFALEKILTIASKYQLEDQILTAVNDVEMTAFHLAIGYKNDFALNRISKIASERNSMKELLTSVDIEGNTVLHLSVLHENVFALIKITELVANYDLAEELLNIINVHGITVFQLALWNNDSFALNEILELALTCN